MLYWLFYEVLFPQISVFRLFGFLTFRTAIASLTGLVIAILLGPRFIDWLRSLQIRQHIREDGPETHHKKAGTPTMGGLLIITAVVIPTLLFTNLRNPYVWIALFGLVGYGGIGFLDDYMKVTQGRNLGLTAKQKMGLQVLIVLLIGTWLLVLQAKGLYSTTMNVPFLKNVRPDLLIDPLLENTWTYPLAFTFFFIFLWFVIVGASNSVNLTDGLDGLATGLMVIAAGSLTALSYISGHAQFSEYLGLVRMRNVGELSIFCGSMTGACIGFLYYNSHPAELFMGDVGSLSLGGSLGVVAVLLKQEVLLVFIAGVFVAEGASVILQVGSYKLREGKRIFLMAPLHHHFEKKGWPESKVVIRFWIAGLVLALLALTTLKLR